MAKEGEAKEIQAAAMAVMADVAGADRYLMLYERGDGTFRLRARLSRDGRVNLRRLLAAIEDSDPNELLDVLG